MASCEQSFTSTSIADGADWMQLLKRIAITAVHAWEHVCVRVPLMYARWFMRAREISDYFAKSVPPTFGRIQMNMDGRG